MQFSLTSELCFYDQIFRELGLMTLFFFVEASKTSTDFVEVFSSGPRQPEILFCFLNIYETLSTLIPDIEAWYARKAGSFKITKYHKLIRRYGDSMSRQLLLNLRS